MKRIAYLAHRTDSRSPEEPDLLPLLKEILLAPSVHSRSSFPPCTPGLGISPAADKSWSLFSCPPAPQRPAGMSREGWGSSGNVLV